MRWHSITGMAWVVDTGNGPLGIYWWNPSGPHPTEQDGIRTALFRTRTEAREFLKPAKRTYPKAAVRRVSVTIQPTETA